MNKLLIALLIFPLSCFANETITVEKLFKNSSLYNGKKVLALGTLHLEFEGNELRSGNSKIALSLSEPLDMKMESIRRNKETYSKFRNKYNGMLVAVRGIFSLEFKGHEDMWSAGIEDVTFIGSYKKSLKSGTLVYALAR